MASPNTAVYSTVFSYGNNRRIVEGHRSKRLSNMAVFLVFTMLVPYPSLTTLVAPYEKQS